MCHLQPKLKSLQFSCQLPSITKLQRYVWGNRQPPTSCLGQYGILLMDNAGYIDMCGSGAIAIATALIEIGMIPTKEPETVVIFDMPAGLVETSSWSRTFQILNQNSTKLYCRSSY